MYRNSLRAPLCAIAMSLVLSACTQSADMLDDIATSSIATKASHGHPPRERECLARAMFFESNRSSRDGLIAVGSVVMNRVESERYPDTICGVVGQKNQFAPGALSRQMNSKALPDVMAAADSVLRGERHPAVKDAKFFHQAGLKFPYNNMHYVLEAGGNAFYEKRSRRAMQTAKAEPAPQVVQETPALAYGEIDPDAIGALLIGLERPKSAD